MKTLSELRPGECKFALTTSEESDKAWSHASLGNTKGGGAFRHGFCAEPVAPGSNYCPHHHARCHRGFGKDARSLEEMIYALDQSQFRGRVPYEENTAPIDARLDSDVPSRPPLMPRKVYLAVRASTHNKVQ